MMARPGHGGRFGKSLAGAVLAASVAATPPAWGQDGAGPGADADSLVAAARLIQAQRHAEACRQLDALDVPDSQALQRHFLLGQCRFGLQDYATAAHHYELMLERNTNLPRVRFELARTLAAMGKGRAAKEEAARVLADPDIPEAVRANIQRFAAELDARKRWGGTVFAGYLYDSNANGAPSNPNITAFGLPFVLDRDSTRRSAHAFQSSVAIGTTFDMPVADEWRADLFGNMVEYEGGHGVDTHSLGLSMGPQFYGNIFLSLPVGYRFSWERHAKASDSISFSPSIGKSLTQDLRVNAQIAVSHERDLRTGGTADGFVYGVNLNSQYRLPRGDVLEFGVGASRNDADDLVYQRSRSGGVSAGYFALLPLDLRLAVQPSVTRVRFEGADPVDAGRERRDNRFVIDANLSRDVAVGDVSFTPVLSATWTRNASNIARRDYERTQVAIAVRKQF